MSLQAKRVGGGAACLVAVLAVPLWGSPEIVDESIEVVEVEVPVQVLLDGRPLRGLQREDFELSVDGRRTPIEGFAVVDHAVARRRGAGSASRAEALPLAARRHFLLLLDLSFASVPNVLRARDAAIQLVRERIGDGDLVSVATLSAVRGVTVLVGFTPDRQRVVEALEELGRRHLAEGLRDPLGLVFLGPVDEEPVRPVGKPGEAADALGDDLTEAALSSSYKGLTAALEELAETLRPVAARTHVLYLSEGVDSRAFLGHGRGATQREREEIERTNEAAMRGEIWSVNSNERFGSTSALGDLERSLKEFVRAGAEIDAVDIGGLRAETDVEAAGEDTLFLMARDTGGELVRSHNDLEAAMGRVLDRTEVTYLLTFTVPTDRKPGRYERITVKLRERRPGTELVHRPGYFTPFPFAQRSAAERRAEAVRRLLEDGEPGDLGLDVRLGEAGRLVDGRRSLPVAVRVDLAGVEASSHRELELYGYAMTDDGRVADYFFARLTPDPDGAGLEGETELALPPGSYTLRCLARESVEGRFGRATVAVRVSEIDLRNQESTLGLVAVRLPRGGNSAPGGR